MYHNRFVEIWYAKLHEQKTNKKFWDEKHVDQNDEHYAFKHKQTKDSKMLFLHNIMQHIYHAHIFLASCTHI